MMAADHRVEWPSIWNGTGCHLMIKKPSLAHWINPVAYRAFRVARRALPDVVHAEAPNRSKYRLLPIVVACCTKPMGWFAWLSILLQRIGERSGVDGIKLIFLLLSRGLSP